MILTALGKRSVCATAKNNSPRGLTKVETRPTELTEGTRAVCARHGLAQSRNFRLRRPMTLRAFMQRPQT